MNSLKILFCKIRDWLFRNGLICHYNNKKNGNHIISKSKVSNKKLQILFYGKNNVVNIGDNVTIESVITIKVFGDNNKVTIGSHNVFHKAIFWVEDDSSELIIGDNNFFAGSSFGISVIEGNTIRIGDNNLFSDNVDIRNGDSHGMYDFSSKKRINYSCDITIGDHNWICKDVSILKRGSIGSDNVIANNSVVTKDFSSYKNVVIGGIPATILKEGILWDSGRSDIYED